MKYLFGILLGLFIVSLSNCKDNGDDLASPRAFFSTGNAQATRNGMAWDALGIMDMAPPFEDRWGIIIRRFNERGFARESLSIAKIKNNRTRQELFNDQIGVLIDMRPDTVDVFYTTLVSDGDVLGDVYVLVREGNENWLQITEIDEANRRVKGIFEIHLTLRENNEFTDPNAEPTIDFVNGSFDLLAPESFFDN